MKKLIILNLALLSVFFVSITGMAQQRLFTEFSQQRNTIDGKSAQILENVGRKAVGEQVQVLNFNTDALQASQLLINIQGKEFEFVLDELDIRNSDDFSWHGHEKGGVGYMVLVYSKGEMAGNLFVSGRTYSISPFGTGAVTFYEINPASYPPDHPEGAKQKVYDMTGNAGSVKQNAETVIRVLVAYTSSAESGVAGLGYSDITLFLQEAISETNQSFINSNVAHRLKLAVNIEVGYNESSSSERDLDRFISTSDGYMDEIHSYRNYYSADVGVLIINNDDYCGVASGIGSNANSAFCVVHYECVLGYYSFAHEIAHLHGCRHNSEVDPNTSPFAYGHGYISPGNWRTIMAYNNYCNCPRIQYWSNPDISYGGRAMGNSSTSDNARVLDATAPTVSNYRTAVTNLNLAGGASLADNESGEAIATSSITLSSGFNVAYGAVFKATTGVPAAGAAIAENTLMYVQDNVVNADAIGEEFLQVFPNPTTGMVDVKFMNSDDEFQMELFDANGTEIYRMDYSNLESVRINLSNKPSGIYYIQIKDSKGAVHSKRIILE
ncbi:zinc-dependent metalloprotease [Fulvivirga sediminis]|uniref:Zinc-dependent metalloprotease n=1 Tax=Fulvivirga sediminis TaxID=2803949 RepID=A0A937F7P2_9BACT|nr:zinc-dependent metalloprotease [Fulvivirga sediminis]MBL3657861.1 zinc-dependent metalloprotease [Fulvivirga sediminis]